MKRMRGKKLICIFLIMAIIVILTWSINNKEVKAGGIYSDGIEQPDLNTIYLKNSGVQADFSRVIIGSDRESRKLLVYEQEATVSTMLTDRLIKKLDIEWLKKTQNISYTGKGYFVVDLDRLKEEDIIQNEKEKSVTIKIEHAYLEGIDIHPENIVIDEVKESLLAKGDIKLSVADYNQIEKRLREMLESEFNTPVNVQRADDIALKAVKQVYEPIIQAIDSKYKLYVEFKGKDT